jgi:hypothetical protein
VCFAEATVEGCVIEFLNWDTYQGEAKRYDSTTWFRLSNTLYEHELWDELDDAEFRGLMYLFQRTSREGHKTGRYRVIFRTESRMSGVSAAKLRSAVLKLRSREMGILKLHSVDAPCTIEELAVLSPPPPQDEPVNPPASHGEVTGHPPADRSAYDHDNDPPPPSACASGAAGKNCGPVEELSAEGTRELLATFPQKLQHAWLKAYPAGWIVERLQALAAYAVVRQERGDPLEHLQAYATWWLDRDWRARRKKPGKRTVAGGSSKTVTYLLPNGMQITESRDAYERWVKGHEAGTISAAPPPLLEGGA